MERSTENDKWKMVFTIRYAGRATTTDHDISGIEIPPYILPLLLPFIQQCLKGVCRWQQ
jgi:hypothetical protein